MGTTPNRAYPWPEETEIAGEAWEHIKELAEAIDADVEAGAVESTSTLGRDHHAQVGVTSTASPGTSVATVAITVPAIVPLGSVLGVLITIRHQQTTMTPYVAVEIDGVLTNDLGGSAASRITPPSAGAGTYYTTTLYLEFAMPSAGAHTVEVQAWHDTAGTQNTTCSATVKIA
jgi:hypothetical protein